MATYEAVLTDPQSMDETFAFVSVLRNAARWDPCTYGVEKVTGSPIGVGTRFTPLRAGAIMDGVRTPERHGWATLSATDSIETSKLLVSLVMAHTAVLPVSGACVTRVP